ncbi:MAG: NADH-quinone oxidoreductase subunit G [Bifidobacteriaceae bacterium]|nr:NADH-quinone oxidoreductase subunit G [Bifidobacteriaceae bacterium]
MTAQDLVTLTVDGIEVAVPKGTLIIRAAEEAGILIPRFCDHPLLKPVAACRQCLVDVASPFGPEGTLRPFPKPQPACAIAVSEGMVVNTQLTSPVAAAAQAAVTELILINHPLDCPICDKGGECPLQNQALHSGRPTSRYTEPKNTFAKPLALTPQLLIDRERCVLCQRCTRFAAQIPGDPFIALQKRGASQQIGRFDPDVLGMAVPDGEGPFAGDVPAVDGRPFAGYFAGNVVQICPVGALTSAAYRFRARPFDLVSTETVAGHDASCSTIRVDYRRGTVLRVQAGDDPSLNDEWITDKDRFAFRWTAGPDRLRTPLVRRDGVLEEASWPEALAAAAQILTEAKSTAVLPGGRLTLEDAFAYAVFARRVLGTDDVDFRARPASEEEADFLAHVVAGSGEGVTFAELTAAPAVLFVGSEPEDEGGVVYLRLRGAGTKVYSVAALASRGLKRLGGTLIPAVPGAEADVLAGLKPKAKGVAGEAAKELSGGVIVVGERLATVPGAYTAAVAAAERLGARLVWLPRRAGERAAVEAGLLPGLAPAGRSLAEVGQDEALSLFGTTAPAKGRDLGRIIRAAAAGRLDAIVVGGLEVADLPDPTLAAHAFERAKVVALQVRRDEVAEYADVVLPVAPAVEKPGTFINWEGRLRPFPQVLTSTALSDGRVLQALAQKLGVSVPLGQVETVHQVLAALGRPAQRPAAPAAGVPAATAVPAGSAVLATWHNLVDDAAAADYEPHLAASAPLPVATVSPATAKAVGVTEGGRLAVSTDREVIDLPARIDPTMVDGVVHLPTKSPGSHVRAALGAAHGSVVKLALAGKGAGQ